MIGLLVAGAMAGILGSVGTPVEIDTDRSGNWGRIFPSDTGWDLFFAAGGEYRHLPLDAGFQPDLTRLTSLTGHSDLVDHAITRCPDGTWLHVASATELDLDDSAWAFLYDADLQRTHEVQLFSSEPLQEHRDMPVVCGESFQGVGFFEPDSFIGLRVFELDNALSIVREVEPEHPCIATGSSMYLQDDGRLAQVGFFGNDVDNQHISEYDVESFELLDRHIQDVSPAGMVSYWSQGVVQVGDHYVVAFMVRDPDAGWAAQDGDVWIAVYNLDWRLEEKLQISDETPPDGAMQPWVAWDGANTLAVMWTASLQIYVAPVTVELEKEAVSLSLPVPSSPSGCAGVAPLFGLGLGLRRFGRRARRLA